MTEKPKHMILPIEDQPKDQLYSMSMKFKADAGSKSMDEVIDMCFPGERVVLKDGISLQLAMTLPFIPDKPTLKKYVSVLQDSYEKSSGNIRLTNVRFDGYDYLYAVNPGSEPARAQPCVHLKNGVCSTGASSTGLCMIPCSHYETEN